MSIIRQWFRPTAAGWVLFALLLGVQGILINSSVTYLVDGQVWSLRTTSIGLPVLVEIVEPGTDAITAADQGITIFWRRMGAVVLGCYLMAMPLGRLVSRGVHRDFAPPVWRHPAMMLSIAILTVMACAILMAIYLPGFDGAGRVASDPWQGATNAEFDQRFISFMSFTLAGLFFVMPITILVMIVRRWRERKRTEILGFPIDVGA